MQVGEGHAAGGGRAEVQSRGFSLRSQGASHFTPGPPPRSPRETATYKLSSALIGQPTLGSPPPTPFLPQIPPSSQETAPPPRPQPCLPWIFPFGFLPNSEVRCHNPFLTPKGDRVSERMCMRVRGQAWGGGRGGVCHKHATFVLPGRPEGLEPLVVTQDGEGSPQGQCL